jgi:hypothetical protein
MMIDLVTKEDLQRLRLQLLNDMTRILSQQELHDTNGRWLTPKETRKALRISGGTLNRLRAEGKIKSKKVGSHYRYQPE